MVNPVPVPYTTVSSKPNASTRNRMRAPASRGPQAGPDLRCGRSWRHGGHLASLCVLPDGASGSFSLRLPRPPRPRLGRFRNSSASHWLGGQPPPARGTRGPDAPDQSIRRSRPGPRAWFPRPATATCRIRSCRARWKRMTRAAALGVSPISVRNRLVRCRPLPACLRRESPTRASCRPAPCIQLPPTPSRPRGGSGTDAPAGQPPGGAGSRPGLRTAPASRPPPAGQGTQFGADAPERRLPRARRGRRVRRPAGRAASGCRAAAAPPGYRTARPSGAISAGDGMQAAEQGAELTGRLAGIGVGHHRPAARPA